MSVKITQRIRERRVNPFISDIARDRLRFGGTIDPERLTRFERGLGISACAPLLPTAANPVPTGARAQESPVTTLGYYCSEVLTAVRDVFGIVIIASCFIIPPIFLIWIGFLILRPLVEPILHFLNLS